MSQVDNVWTIYSKIIDETCKKARPLQNEAVLELVKEKWMTLLRERLSARREVKQEQVDSAAVPVGATMAKRGATAMTGIGPNRYSPNKRAILATGIAPRPEKFDTDMAAAGLVEDPRHGRIQPTQQENEQAKQAWETIQAIDAPTPTEPDESKKESEDDDDEWGEWVESDREVVKADVKSAAPEEVIAPASEVIAESMNLEPPAGTIGAAAASGDYLPRDEDFAARLTTQYGRGNWDGNAWGEDPDEVDSDMDNVSDLEDEEPEARDVLVAQCVEVAKPPGRKPQTTGTWKIIAKDGIASINGHEIFFAKLTAELDFRGVGAYKRTAPVQHYSF